MFCPSNRFKLLFADLNVTAKKWRFYNGNKIQSSGWAPYWKVAEAKLYSDYACRNEIDLTATSFTATEKDHYQCSDASKAFDGVAEEGNHLVGKCESRWGPNDGNRNPEMSWFGIDFDEPVAIGCVQFYQFTDYCQERIHVKYQDANDENWKTFKMVEDINCASGGWSPAPPQGRPTSVFGF